MLSTEHGEILQTCRCHARATRRALTVRLRIEQFQAWQEGNYPGRSRRSTRTAVHPPGVIGTVEVEDVFDGYSVVWWGSSLGYAAAEWRCEVISLERGADAQEIPRGLLRLQPSARESRRPAPGKCAIDCPRESLIPGEVSKPEAEDRAIEVGLRIASSTATLSNAATRAWYSVVFPPACPGRIVLEGVSQALLIMSSRSEARLPVSQ